MTFNIRGENSRDNAASVDNRTSFELEEEEEKLEIELRAAQLQAALLKVSICHPLTRHYITIFTTPIHTMRFEEFISTNLFI